MKWMKLLAKLVSQKKSGKEMKNRIEQDYSEALKQLQKKMGEGNVRQWLYHLKGGFLEQAAQCQALIEVWEKEQKNIIMSKNGNHELKLDRDKWRKRALHLENVLGQRVSGSDSWIHRERVTVEELNDLFNYYDETYGQKTPAERAAEERAEQLQKEKKEAQISWERKHTAAYVDKLLSTIYEIQNVIPGLGISFEWDVYEDGEKFLYDYDFIAEFDDKAYYRYLYRVGAYSNVLKYVRACFDNVVQSDSTSRITLIKEGEDLPRYKFTYEIHQLKGVLDRLKDYFQSGKW